MNRKINWMALILVLFISYGFHTRSTIDFVVPKGWPKPRYDFDKKPLTKAKIELGRLILRTLIV